MNKIILFCACICLSAAAKSDSQPPNVLHVAGEGKVVVVPDTFNVSFVIEERGPVVSKLSEKVNDTLSSLVGFLLASGIDENNIASMAVSLQPWYEHTQQGREHKGFMLHRTVSVASQEIQSYDKILDGAMTRGVKRIANFEFVLANPKEAYESALLAAIKDAKHRAKLIAEELNVDIEGVVQVSENTQGNPMPQYSRMLMQEDSSMSLPGTQDIIATVNVTFAIED